MKKIISALGIILAAASLTGCGGSTSSVPTEIIVRDGEASQTDGSVFPVKLKDGTIIEQPPESAASLSPAVTEILAELGFADRLCAVSRYCDYPENINAQAAGSSENPDIDTLTELSPDVLFTLTPLSVREAYSLESAGITVVELTAPESVSGYGELYGTIAAVFEGEEAGTAAAQKAEQSLSDAAAGLSLGSFVYVTPKLTAAGSDTFEDAVLSLCAENVCTAEGYTSSPEDIAQTPQYIIAADSLSEADITGSGLFGDTADDAMIIFVPSERFERPSARISDIFSAITAAVADTEQTVE